ncbi:MAG: hypothetical protein HQK84_02290 [Nitrospinae bacterium]|nr:hypothetical protein [Nitrospinota bacterium]
MAFLLIVFTFIVNTVSGYIRMNYPEKSRARIRCFYIPITISIILRQFSGVSWEVIPALVAVALLGLYLGGKLNRHHKA